MRKAKILLHQEWVGILTENEHGYSFEYLPNHLAQPHAEPISLTLPIQSAPYRSQVLFPFFDGLIPEGWLLDMVEKNWKVNARDRMGILLVACKDCIGAVSVEPWTEN